MGFLESMGLQFGIDPATLFLIMILFFFLIFSMIVLLLILLLKDIISHDIAIVIFEKTSHGLRLEKTSGKQIKFSVEKGKSEKLHLRKGNKFIPDVSEGFLFINSYGFWDAIFFGKKQSLFLLKRGEGQYLPVNLYKTDVSAEFAPLEVDTNAILLNELDASYRDYFGKKMEELIKQITTLLIITVLICVVVTAVFGWWNNKTAQEMAGKATEVLSLASEVLKSQRIQ